MKTQGLLIESSGRLEGAAWRPQFASSESLLSKSLGDRPGQSSQQMSDSLSRSTSEITSISYRGYLLKRSNVPHSSSIHPVLDPSSEEKPPQTKNLLAMIDTRAPPPCETNERDNVPPPQIPQHLMLTEESSETNITDDNNEEAILTPIDESIQLLANFFGVDGTLDEICTNNSTVEPLLGATVATPVPVVPPVPQSPTKSAPIAFGKQPSASTTTTDYTRSLHRRDSAPIKPTKVSKQPPDDMMDPKDGHLWRAKYCVLEDGILYFYNHALDGESADAHHERLQTAVSLQAAGSSDDQAPITMEATDLSKSPLPRRFISSSGIGDSIGKGEKGVLWEKRVILDCVGAVRSAESEYGPYSFELLAVEDDEETTDKLVLRARNAEEMNEWLFQFHRSLASFMMNIVESVGASPAGFLNAPMFDIHHPGFYPMMAPPIRDISPRAASPRLRMAVQNIALSHGHGRSGMHRRRLTEEDKPKPTKAFSIPFAPFAFDDKAARITPPLSDRATFRDDETPESVQPVAQASIDDESPEIVSRGTCPPENERPPPVTPAKGKYVPPHLRNKESGTARQSGTRYVPPAMRRRMAEEETQAGAEFLSLEERAKAPVALSLDTPTVFELQPPVEEAVSHLVSEQTTPWYLGGCADPSGGSILDPKYKGRSDSRIGKVPLKPFGCFGGDDSSILKWEIGAASECGIRDSNEDAFMVCSDLTVDCGENDPALFSSRDAGHNPGVFAIFDGHCGNQAARYSAENLIPYLRKEFQMRGESSTSAVEEAQIVLKKAVTALDEEFCRVCVEDGRAWESGSTAIIAVIVDGHVVIANIGDCSAVMGRSVHLDRLDNDLEASLHDEGWAQGDNQLEARSGRGSDRWSYWKEVADVHSPSRPDELRRIKEANGWITTEKEIPIGQLQRMDFLDEDVVEILKRCFTDRFPQSQSAALKKCSAAPQRILHISRVCGELAVSRAIGDRDFKGPSSHGNVNQETSDPVWWDCPLFLPYPDNHSKKFTGNLVSAEPEIQFSIIEQGDVTDDFLLLACDGLWDVMDPDDAIRVTRGLLFEKQWSAKKAAARLTELAIHLGSSDNITVVVIRFFK